MSTGLWVAIAAVLVTVAVGLYRLRTDGAFRSTKPAAPIASQDGDSVDPQPARSLLADTPWQSQLGERATLLQFSSAFCAPCRATRRVLDEVATITPGVTHVEVDAEQHLEVVRRLGITRTPTTLVLNADGVEQVRASGAARKEQVLAALAGFMGRS